MAHDGRGRRTGPAGRRANRRPRGRVAGTLGVLAALGVGLAACAQPETRRPGTGLPPGSGRLGDLIVTIHEDMLLRGDMDVFAQVAADDYVVMIPGGRRETRGEVIAGAAHFDVESVAISDVVTRFHDATAVVTGTWYVDGRLRDVDMTGAYEFLAVYGWTGRAWDLVAESVTRRRPLAEALGGAADEVTLSGEADVLAALAASQEAWNQGDLAGYLAIYADDARWTSGGRVVVGRAAIAAESERRFGTPQAMGRLDTEDLQVELLTPRDALVFGRFVHTAGDEPQRGLFSVHMRRIDGVWRIVSDHASS